MFLVLFSAVSLDAATPPIGTEIINTAVLRYADANGNPYKPISGSVVTKLSSGPVLRVVKSSNSDPIAVGAPIVYTIEYENSGNGAANNVTIVDRLSHLVTPVSHTGVFQQGPPGGESTITWSFPSIPGGYKGKLIINGQVVNDPALIKDGDKIFNTVQASSDETGSQTVLITTVGQNANIILNIGLSSTVTKPGGEITYTINYKNHGNLASTLTGLSIPLPSQTALVEGSISSGGSLSADGYVFWDLGTIDPGGEGQVSFTIRVSPLALNGVALETSAVIENKEQGIIQSDPVISIVTAGPELAIEKSVDSSTAKVGDLLNFTIKVTNTGSVSLEQVAVEDLLPDGLKAVSASDKGVISSGRVAWTIPEIEKGKEKILTLVARVGTTGTITNTVRAWNLTSEIVLATVQLNGTTSEKAVIEFLDSSSNPTRLYDGTSPVQIKVTDKSENKDPTLLDTISVIIKNEETGDSEIVILTETGLNTGIFTGVLPVSFTLTPGNDGTISIVDDSTLIAVYNDPEFPLDPIVEGLAYVNPIGVVFDSLTGEPVSGALVTLMDANTNLPATLASGKGSLRAAGNNFTTGVDGKFQFLKVPPGTYFVKVVPPSDYIYPSTVASSSLPTKFKIMAGSRNDQFAVTNISQPIVFDIPLDRAAKELKVSKTSLDSRATIGDFVVFSVEITNTGNAPIVNLKLKDIFPQGLVPVKGSSRLDGKSIADPVLDGPRILSWTLPTISSGAKQILTYAAVVSVDARSGYIENRAYAAGDHLGRPIVSSVSSARILIREGLFTDRTTVMGKVYLDKNGNGVQDSNEDEPGIGNVTLYLETGVRVETDQDGKYSIPGVRNGSHVLRVDENTLPKGLKPIVGSNRNMGDARSQFLDLTSGGIYLADIPVQGTLLNNRSKDPDPVNLNPVVTSPDEYERQIGSLTPELEILFPHNGSYLAGKFVDLLVKYHHATRISVFLNDELIAEDRVSKQMDHSINKVALKRFKAVKVNHGKENFLKVEAYDSFGNKRAESKARFISVGSLDRIGGEKSLDNFPADGSADTFLTLCLFDKENRLIEMDSELTVDSREVEVLSKDCNQSLEGIQVPVHKGRAFVQIRALSRAGRAKLTCRILGSVQEVDLTFVPNLRDMMFIGLGEVTIGKGTARGDTGPLESRRPFGKDVYSHGRGAFFLKGEVGKGYLLTAAYDSEKEQQEELFQISEKDLRLEYRYPVYGDESRVTYETESRDKFYLRLERGLSSLLYGDYQTDLSENKLGAYVRTFHGVRLLVNEKKLKLKSFIAKSDQTMVVDSLPSLGISGYYQLSNPDIIEGSERVVLETRDRFQPDVVLNRELQERELDYEIDYTLGSIFFKAPIPSRDRDLNPVAVIVTYEVHAQTRNYAKYGGRISYQFNSNIELGMTQLYEDALAGNYRLGGYDISLNLPYNTVIKAEWAKTDSMVDDGLGLIRREDKGRSVELNSKPNDKLEISAAYRKSGANFQNLSAVDVYPGSKRITGDLSYAYDDETKLRSSHFHETDTANDGYYRKTSVGIEKSFDRNRMALDLMWERSKDRYIPLNNRTTRHPFDIAEQSPERLNSYRVFWERLINKRLSMYFSHKQSVKFEKYQLSHLGADYLLRPGTKFYVIKERARFDATADDRLIAGVESQVTRNMVAFSEYRLGQGAGADRLQRSMGLRNRFLLGSSITANFSIERLETTRGPELNQEPDATALAAAVEYLPDERLKLFTRYERRLANTGNVDTIDLGAAWRLQKDFQLLLESRTYDFKRNTGNSTNSRTVIGMAYRPIGYSRFNALAKIERKDGMGSGIRFGEDTDALIGSLDFAYKANRSLKVFGRFAQKETSYLSYNNRTRLISSRVLYDINPKWDVSLEYRFMRGNLSQTLHRGGAMELGYLLTKNVWLSAGYSFDDFDSDLTGDSYEGKGPYIRFRFKALEDWLDRQF